MMSWGWYVSSNLFPKKVDLPIWLAYNWSINPLVLDLLTTNKAFSSLSGVESADFLVSFFQSSRAWGQSEPHDPFSSPEEAAEPA